MNVLITGIAGAVGSYLAEYIVKERPEVTIFGTVRRSGHEIPSQVQQESCDLMWSPNTMIVRIIKDCAPDIIFHLASWANVRDSFERPGKFLENNILCTSNLFEAVRLSGLDPVIVLASTSEIYGKVLDISEVPIKETNQLRPANPYAVSKAAQDLLAWTYFNAYGTRIIRTRSFGYINPRRADLAASNFAQQIAAVERGKQNAVTVGNLSSVRTFLDVRDVVRAYWTAAERCKAGEAYNIGSPVPVAIGTLLNWLINISGHKIPVEHDETLVRPADLTNQIPDISKFVAATGWTAEIPLAESLRWLLEYWRGKING